MVRIHNCGVQYCSITQVRHLHFMTILKHLTTLSLFVITGILVILPVNAHAEANVLNLNCINNFTFYSSITRLSNDISLRCWFSTVIRILTRGMLLLTKAKRP